MADKRTLSLILALSVIAAPIFIVAVACNATSVATVNWVAITWSGSGVSDIGQAVLGLWKLCVYQPSAACITYDDAVSSGSTDLRYIYASRALSLAPPAISIVITLPLVLMGLIARKGIFLAFAAGTAVLEMACLVTALVVFFVKTMLLFKIPGESDIDLDFEVLPGWSFYVGGIGVLFYFLGALWLFFLGVAATVVEKRLERNGGASFGGGMELSAQASVGEGFRYTPLTASSE